MRNKWKVWKPSVKDPDWLKMWESNKLCQYLSFFFIISSPQVYIDVEDETTAGEVGWPWNYNFDEIVKIFVKIFFNSRAEKTFKKSV